MKKPAITKAEFIEIFALLKIQEEKDSKFCNFMEEYLDGRFIPVMNENANLAAMKTLSYCFNDRVTDKYGSTWIDWILYDNDIDNLSQKPAVAYLNKTKYEIKSLEEFYDFLVLWMNHKPKKSK